MLDYILSAYKLQDNNSLILNGISRYYTGYDNSWGNCNIYYEKEKSYRKFLVKNIDNDDFLIKPMQLRRLDGDFKEGSNFDKQDKRQTTIATLGATIIGAVGLFSIMQSDNEPGKNWEKVIGFDNYYNPVYEGSKTPIAYDLYGNKK